MSPSSPTTPDYTAIKQKQHAAWSSGDYARIGATLQIVGEQLAETLSMSPTSSVLDVAAGNGNITLAMARRSCNVTSTDYVEELLASGQRRAAAEGLEIAFQRADAEQLPFDDGSFDAVVSTFGVMFTPNQGQSAAELLRVCRSGGRIGLANWTPASFIGQLFKVLDKRVPPPAGVSSPANWGERSWLERHFGDQASRLDVRTTNFAFVYKSPQHFIDFFRTCYGPTHKAFATLDAATSAALEADILALVDRCNAATDGSMGVPSEYVEVVVHKR